MAVVFCRCSEPLRLAIADLARRRKRSISRLASEAIHTLVLADDTARRVLFEADRLEMEDSCDADD